MALNPNMTEYEKTLFDKLHKSRYSDSKTFGKRDYQGLWTGIVDKYPDSAHFVYELLQNADDAKATEVHIVLSKNSIVFKHNGSVAFSVTEIDAETVGHINSITAIGNSTKKDLEANTIGKFGVGFKAVFQYTDTPEVYDDKFWFKIENYIIPTLLRRDHKNRNAGETLFYLPFKNALKSYKDIKSRLEKLENPILFLHHLKRVTWENTETKQKGLYEKEIISQNTNHGVTFEVLRLRDFQKQDRLLYLFTRTIAIEDNGYHKISVGYFYDEKKHCLVTTKGQKVYCFFPTSETFNTCYLSHAPFLLNDARQNILTFQEVNEHLVDELSRLAADALVILRDYGQEEKLINENILDIIPLEKLHSVNVYGETKITDRPQILRAFASVIRNNAMLISESGRYLTIGQSILPESINLIKYISKEQLKELCKADVEFLSTKFAQNVREKIASLKHASIELRSYNYTDLAKQLTAAFMAAQDMQWVTRFYKDIDEHAKQLWNWDGKRSVSAYPFLLAPIVKTDKNEWVAPYQENNSLNVYFPIEAANKEFNYICEEYLDKTSFLYKFMCALGIKEPDQKDFIESILLSKYYGDTIERTDDEIKGDFEFLLSHYLSLQNVKAQKEFADQLKDNWYIAAKGEEIYYSPEELHLSNKNLENYYDASDIKVVDIDFYSKSVAKHGLEFVERFLTDVGVCRELQIRQYKRDIYFYKRRYDYSLPAHFELEDNNGDQSFEDYEIEGFHNVVTMKKLSKQASIYIWNLIAHEDLSKYRHMKYRWHYYSPHHKFLQSTFHYSILNLPWLYDKKGKVRAPQNIHVEDLAEEYNKYENLLRFLGIDYKTKSILELGGTREQDRQQKLGKFAEEQGLTKERIQQLLQMEAELNSKKAKDKKKDKKEELQEEHNPNDSFSPRAELEHQDVDDMFVATQRPLPQIRNKYTDVDDAQSKFEELKQKVELDLQKQKELAEIRSQAFNDVKYSYEWFMNLLKLEYSETTSESDKEISKKLSVSFSSITRDDHKGRTFTLREPSSYIPVWVEEVENLAIVFSFQDREDVSFSFDIASVKDYSLQVKGKPRDIQSFDSIDWTKCVQAHIELNNPIQLIGNLKQAFSELGGYWEGEDLKDNLADKELRFIFGPPGTGKTTRLSSLIGEIIQETPEVKILVLAPTNKACDVLTRKLMEEDEYSYQWLRRFVATADEFIEDEDYVCSREEDIEAFKQLCLVSTMARLPFDGFIDMKLKEMEWDYVIIDEASMIPLAYIVYAIYGLEVSTEFIIAGDPMQISPIVQEEMWKEENIYTMVNLKRFDNPETEPVAFPIENLSTQWRSIPAIGQLFSEYSYDGKLLHNRKADSQPKLGISKLKLKAINFFSFKVDRYNSIFSVKKLASSNVHVYSVLFAVEFCKYIIDNLNTDLEKLEDKTFKIGIICPYAAQAQLIEKMLEQSRLTVEGVSIDVGTIHSFQGDQCNMVIAVFNPPMGLAGASNRVLINKQEIINVAISRARDYLCVLMPHSDTANYNKLIEINKLGRIAQKMKKDVATFTCDELEKIMFGRKFYIESNAFVTTHQLANVYGAPEAKYEVRIDEKAADIQLKEN